MHGHNHISIVACPYRLDHARFRGTIGLESYFRRTNNGQHIREILHIEDDLQFRPINSSVDSAGIISQVLSRRFDGESARLQSIIFTRIDLDALTVEATAEDLGDN